MQSTCIVRNTMFPSRHGECNFKREWMVQCCSIVAFANKQTQHVWTQDNWFFSPADLYGKIRTTFNCGTCCLLIGRWSTILKLFTIKKNQANIAVWRRKNINGGERIFYSNEAVGAGLHLGSLRANHCANSALVHNTVHFLGVFVIYPDIWANSKDLQVRRAVEHLVS